MVNLTPTVSFSRYNLQMAGGKLRVFNESNTIVQYDGGRYEVDRDIGLNGSLSNPSIIIRHQIDDQSFKLYNHSKCRVRIVGPNINIPPQSQSGFDVDLSEIDYISVENTDTEESLKFNVNESAEDDEDDVENDGLADTLLENPYSDQDDTSQISLVSILEDAPDAELIGEGSYRVAFKVNPSNIDSLRENDGGIIKVATTVTGRDINQQEMQTWQAVRSGIERRLFCPITSIGKNHKYIVMKEASSINEFDEDAVRSIESKVRGSVLFDSDECELPSPCKMFDIKSRNIGNFGGSAVLIDYPYGGNFELPEEKTEQFSDELRNILY